MSSGGVGPTVNSWSAGQLGPVELLARRKAESEVRTGANWFFWIAGLSMLNALLALLHVRFDFLLGLSLTQIIDRMAVNQGAAVADSAPILEAALLGTFLVLGAFARARRTWAFVAGILLYGLDSLLFLNSVLGLWFMGFADVDIWTLLVPAAIHGYALFRMIRGLDALWRLAALDDMERQYKLLEKSWAATSETTTPTYIVNSFSDESRIMTTISDESRQVSR